MSTAATRRFLRAFHRALDDPRWWRDDPDPECGRLFDFSGWLDSRRRPAPGAGWRHRRGKARR